MVQDLSENLVPVLYFSQELIQNLIISPCPISICEQLQVFNTEDIPATCPAGTAGTPVDTALRLCTSVVVGICTQVY